MSDDQWQSVAISDSKFKLLNSPSQLYCWIKDHGREAKWRSVSRKDRNIHFDRCSFRIQHLLSCSIDTRCGIYQELIIIIIINPLSIILLWIRSAAKNYIFNDLWTNLFLDTQLLVGIMKKDCCVHNSYHHDTYLSFGLANFGQLG